MLFRSRVIIQTYTPESPIIKYSMENDYEKLYKDEIEIRKRMNYPPFSKIFLINCQSKNEEILKKFMNNLGEKIEELLGKEKNLEILGPVPCIIKKIKENYRWQIMIKGNFNEEIPKKIKYILYELTKSVYNEIRVSMDTNPNNMA